MPVAVVALLITGVGGLIVNVKAAVPVPVAFDALNVTEDIPAAVGVPVMAPVAVLMLNPAGSPVAL